MKKKLIYAISFIFLFMFAFDKIVYANTLDCNSWGALKTDFQNVFNFMKIIVPLLIVGLSTYDFLRAVTAKDDKDLKKAFQKLIKRFVLAVIFFFLPVLINLILDMIEINSSVCIS